MLEMQSLKTNHDLLLAEAAFLDGENAQWATFVKDLPSYNLYHAELVQHLRKHFGDRITVYRPMSRREYEAIFILDASRPLLVTMREGDAKAETMKRDLLCFKMEIDPSAIIMRGRPALDELVIDSCLVLKSRISVVVTENL
jgi:hypothetical protein